MGRVDKMALQEALRSFTSCNTEAGSFTLTKLWIEKAENIELSATAVSVMTALLWHYNPAKKYVFPHQETIAKRVKRSIATVKRAIAELKKAGFIVSSRTRNGNLYAFTQKLFDTLKSQSCSMPEAQNEPTMNHEHVKEQRNNNMAVVVPLKEFKGVEGEMQGASSTAVSVSPKTHYDLNKIPDLIIKMHESGKIKKLNAYWGSLRPAVKLEYWEQDTAEKEKARLKAELKRQNEERKAAELEAERKRKEELAKPLEEQWTKEEAIKHIWTMRKMIKERHIFRTGMVKQLAEAFKLDIDEIISMPEI